MFNALNKNHIYSPTSTSYPQLIRVIKYWFFSSGKFENPNIFSDRENFENGKGKDIIQDQNLKYDEFFETFLAQVLRSPEEQEPIETTLLYPMKDWSSMDNDALRWTTMNVLFRG